ncbi:hypothetical protein Lalb_Chr19g0130971 [Lupinus albus]|uniref:Uncharacterized protein n=1 Tax=Lupinus albus TaxID=3870 RepID=A0A6A4P0Y4_LUPAL|nr:hypothetical protein Lalb_Chr19g0130971 [Lupinus albus]
MISLPKNRSKWTTNTPSYQVMERVENLRETLYLKVMVSSMFSTYKLGCISEYLVLYIRA